MEPKKELKLDSSWILRRESIEKVLCWLFTFTGAGFGVWQQVVHIRNGGLYEILWTLCMVIYTW